MGKMRQNKVKLNIFTVHPSSLLDSKTCQRILDFGERTCYVRSVQYFYDAVLRVRLSSIMVSNLIEDSMDLEFLRKQAN
jgi:hypothetical protein